MSSLLAQMVERAGQEALVIQTSSRPWASALFEGRRHIVQLRFAGIDRDARIAAFRDGLEDAEWALTGHFVADISVDDCVETDCHSTLHLSALTIEDW